MKKTTLIIIVVAFLPEGKLKLSTKQEVDVISSASRKRPAANLVKSVLLDKVKNILQLK